MGLAQCSHIHPSSVVVPAPAEDLSLTIVAGA